MKKRLLITASVVMIALSMSACAKPKDKKEESTVEETTIEETKMEKETEAKQENTAEPILYEPLKDMNYCKAFDDNWIDFQMDEMPKVGEVKQISIFAFDEGEEKKAISNEFVTIAPKEWGIGEIAISSNLENFFLPKDEIVVLEQRDLNPIILATRKGNKEVYKLFPKAIGEDEIVHMMDSFTFDNLEEKKGINSFETIDDSCYFPGSYSRRTQPAIFRTWIVDNINIPEATEETSGVENLFDRFYPYRYQEVLNFDSNILKFESKGYDYYLTACNLKNKDTWLYDGKKDDEDILYTGMILARVKDKKAQVVEYLSLCEDGQHIFENVNYTMTQGLRFLGEIEDIKENKIWDSEILFKANSLDRSLD